MRTIKAYKHYYKEFFDSLSRGVQEKILYGMLKLKNERFLSSKFVKLIRDGLYELRIEYQGNIVILFNGFQKKTDKTPKQEIDKALRLKQEYYEQKGNGIV